MDEIEVSDENIQILAEQAFQYMLQYANPKNVDLYKLQVWGTCKIQAKYKIQDANDVIRTLKLKVQHGN